MADQAPAAPASTAATPPPTGAAGQPAGRAAILSALAAKSGAPGAAKTSVIGTELPAGGAPKGTAPPKPAAKPDADKGGDDKGQAPSIATIAKLSKELREAKEQLKKLGGGDKPKTVTKDDFLKQLRENPGLLFKEIADDPDLLVKLAEARHQDLSPEAQERAQERARIEKLEKELADNKRSSVEERVYAATAKILTDGIEVGDVKIPAGKWPLCARVAAAQLEDVPREAMSTAQAMVRDLGRSPTDAEAAQLIEIAYDALEATYRKRAEVFRLEEAGKKNDTSERRKNTPRTLSGSLGSGGHAPQPPPDKPVNKHQRRQERLGRLRDELAKQAHAG